MGFLYRKFRTNEKIFFIIKIKTRELIKLKIKTKNIAVIKEKIIIDETTIWQ